jgi:signal transduction histidine kinase
MLKPIRRSSVALAELLDEVIAGRLDTTAVELEVRAHPCVEGQARMLSLAIENLIDNAVEASPPDGVVRVSLAADDSGAAVIEVSDDGPGVPTVVLAHLFEPFCTTRFHAAGLGLAASSSIAHAHGGALEHHHSPTTFLLRLPIST